MSSGKISLPHTCPNCKKVTAHAQAELREKFGLRTITTSGGDKFVRNQSWCKDCRLVVCGRLCHTNCPLIVFGIVLVCRYGAVQLPSHADFARQLCACNS